MEFYVELMLVFFCGFKAIGCLSLRIALWLVGVLRLCFSYEQTSLV
jgi:hypothetical protein